ncbi:unnamed protein product [Ectocarpus sp. 12 AP-2014]
MACLVANVQAADRITMSLASCIQGSLHPSNQVVIASKTMPCTPGYDTFLLIHGMRSSPLPGGWVFCPSNGVLLESGSRSRDERTTVQYSSRYTPCFSRCCNATAPRLRQSVELRERTRKKYVAPRYRVGQALRMMADGGVVWEMGVIFHIAE